MRPSSFALVSLALALSACAAPKDSASYGQSDRKFTIRGVGASSPGPLYAAWANEYGNVDTSASVVYSATKSSDGEAAILKHSVDFGGTDEIISEERQYKREGTLLQLPATLSAVAVVYRLAGGPAHLRLTARVVADILLGTIDRWDNPQIAAINPGARLPPDPIRVVVRGEPSGTTTLMADYLGAQSPAWKSRIPTVTEGLSLPKGASVVKGNDALVQAFGAQDGTFSFVPYGVALSKHLTTAALQNAAGRFVPPSLEGVTAAATRASGLRGSLLNLSGETTYPLVAFSYIDVDRSQAAGQGRALAKFLWWVTHDGQRFGPALGFATLPSETVVEVETALLSMTAGGEPAISP